MLEGNPGFAAAVNCGAEAASQDVLVFMNDDLSLEASAILNMANLARDLDAVVVPAVRGADGCDEPSLFALPTPRTLLLEWALMPDRRPSWLLWPALEKWRRPDVLSRVQAAAATTVACPKHLLEVEPMPTDYFLYWEEAEWFWHLREAGVDVWFDPSTVVQHAGGRSDVRSQKSVLLARNAVRCVRRTQGRRAALLAWPVVILWNLRLVTLAAVRLGAARGSSNHLRSRLAGLGAAIVALVEVR